MAPFMTAVSSVTCPTRVPTSSGPSTGAMGGCAVGGTGGGRDPPVASAATAASCLLRFAITSAATASSATATSAAMTPAAMAAFEGPDEAAASVVPVPGVVGPEPGGVLMMPLRPCDAPGAGETVGPVTGPLSGPGLGEVMGLGLGAGVGVAASLMHVSPVMSVATVVARQAVHLQVAWVGG